MRILGIDPGTAIVGFGVIDKQGFQYETIDYGCIRTEATLTPAARLKEIFDGMNNLISLYKPDEIAVEQLFFNKNATTAISVAQARGVVLLAAEQHGLIIGEYTPLQVKQAIAGFGRAEKKQVQFMVKTILKLSEIPRPDDAADALAVAICHSNWSGMRLHQS